MWKLYALLSALFAALTAIFAKQGVRDVDANLATAIRVSLILVLVWSIVFLTGAQRGLPAVGRGAFFHLALSAAATGLSWLFYFKALQLADASVVAPLDKLSVPLVMVFAFVFLKEPVTAKGVAGGLCIAGGSLLLLWK